MTATLDRHARNGLLAAIVVMLPAAALADDEEIPDMEFLEYLGMWEESDDEWLLLEQDAVAENTERSEPVPEGEESTEKEDES